MYIAIAVDVLGLEKTANNLPFLFNRRIVEHSATIKFVSIVKKLMYLMRVERIDTFLFNKMRYN